MLYGLIIFLRKVSMILCRTPQKLYSLQNECYYLEIKVNKDINHEDKL